MSYTKENLQLAAEIISRRRTEAQELYNLRHTEVTAKIPSIAQYESQMAQSGLAVIKAFGMGENAEKYIEELSEINLRIQGYIKDELVKNGYPEDYLEVPYTCTKCGDTGFSGGYVCECRKNLLKELNVADLEPVSPAAQCRFDNFDLSFYPESPDPKYGISPRERMGDILEYCKCYADDFDSESCSLYLNGATGLGKTHLSLAIANVVAGKGYNIVYDSAQNLLSALEREKFSYGSQNDEEEKILGCDLLIIDDLGSEFSTQFTVSALYNIINTRINTSKPVIISTNLTGKELEAKYSQRVTSRIIGNYTSLLFVGNDVRQIKNNY